MSSVATDSAPKPVARGNQWQPGQSGNPKGRPKGSRNHLVELQQKLEVVVRDHVNESAVKAILNAIVSKAIAGDVKAAKLILDKIIPNATPVAEGEENRERTVVFRIVNATFGAPQVTAEPSEQAIEAEFTDTPPTSVLQDPDGNQTTE